MADAFPRMLRSFARKVPDPYRTAFRMAAEEIEELRQLAETVADYGANSMFNAAERDVKAGKKRK